MKTYAKVDEKGNVIQWPIYEIHIKNKGIPKRFFEEVQEKNPKSFDRRTQKISPRPPIRNSEGIFEQSWEVSEKHIDVIKEEMKKDLSYIRWQKEVSGFEHEEFGEVGTSREEQSQIANLFSSVNADIVSGTRWKFNGFWVYLDKTKIVDLAKRTVAHVETCFNAESDLSEKIESCETLNDLKEIDIKNEFESMYSNGSL